ncbi:MAG: hypothetical protein ACNA7I_09530 [Candidatus Methanoperedens sp.]
MNNELNELILTVDTREQNTRRIDTLRAWFEAHGGATERTKLDLCDYRIEGTFRGVEINLGIEAKSLGDFSTSFQDLPDKLARSYELYTDVGLFIEMGNYTFTPEEDDFHSNVVTVVNPRDNISVSVPLAVLENLTESLQTDGIHVRQLRSEFHFPYAVADLLIYLVNPIHTGLEIKSKGYEYINVLAKMPGVGYKTALKISDKFKSLHDLCACSLPELQGVVGKKKGLTLNQFIHNDKSVGVAPISSTPSSSHPGTGASFPRIPIQSPVSDDKSAGGSPVSPAPFSSHSSTSSSPPVLDDPRSDITQPHTNSLSSGDTSSYTKCTNMGMCGDRTDAALNCAPCKRCKAPQYMIGAECAACKACRTYQPGFKEVVKNSELVRDKMNLRRLLTQYLNTPHTLQEIQDNPGKDFQNGYTWDMVMRMKKEGVLVELGNKTFMTTQSKKQGVKK